MASVWIAVSVVGGILFAVGLGRFIWSLRPQPGMSGMPTTPLERLGWIGLIVTTIVAAGLAAISLTQGSSFFEDNKPARLLFWALILVGIGVWAGAWYVIKKRSGASVLDERDRAILARSFSVESVVVLLSLLAWTVTLTEVFGEEGAIPVGYLQLLFWSTFILGAFGRSLGIVLGYRREVIFDA